MRLNGCRVRPRCPTTGFYKNIPRRKHSHRAFRLSCCSSKQGDSIGFVSVKGQSEIGAAYGEGFETLDHSRSLYQVDVAALNRNLRVTGAQRLRHAMKPDEALGAIFVFEGVVVNTRPLEIQSWQLLAEECGHCLPSLMRPHMHDLSPERLIMDVLQWTRDVARARKFSHRLSQIYGELFAGLEEVEEGVVEWLTALQSAKVPCALISMMSRHTIETVLQNLELSEYFSTTTVSFEDDMETTAQKYLCAAMKISRPPEQCVVFDSCPNGVAAAHNCTMKAVAVQGHHKGYQLKQADLTCASLDELTVYNLRRLFANKGVEFMDHKKARDVQKKRARHNVITTY